MAAKEEALKAIAHARKMAEIPEPDLLQRKLLAATLEHAEAEVMRIREVKRQPKEGGGA